MASAFPKLIGPKVASYSPLEQSSDGVGYCYFLGSEDGAVVKIGYSGEKTPKRLRQHQTGDAFGRGGSFETLALVRGTRQAEQFLHAHFAPYLSADAVRSRKSEVYDAEPLIPYLAWLRDQYYVSTTWEEFTSEQGQAVMDPSLWLPGEGKVSTRRSERSLLVLSDPWSALPSRCTTGDDWYTPEEYIVCIRQALGGGIDLDPASHVAANRIVKATRFFTIDQNGLSQPWSGHVYLNPPFSSWPEWVPKVLSEIESPEVCDMVLLGAVRTLTAQYFGPLLRRADGFCVISGRIGFWGIQSDGSPTDGHFLIYLGPDVDRFITSVRPLGAAWKRH
jgi:hypothetical protein